MSAVVTPKTPSLVDTQFRSYKRENALRGMMLAGASLAFNSAFAAVVFPIFKDDLTVPLFVTGVFTTVFSLASYGLTTREEGSRCYSSGFERAQVDIIEKVFNEAELEMELGVRNFCDPKTLKIAGIGGMVGEYDLSFNTHYTDALDLNGYETLVRHEVSHEEHSDVRNGLLFASLSFVPAASLTGVLLMSGQFKEAAVGAAVSLGQFIFNREFSVTIEERADVQSVLRDDLQSVNLTAVDDMHEQMKDVKSSVSTCERLIKKHFPTHPSKTQVAAAINRTFC